MKMALEWLSQFLEEFLYLAFPPTHFLHIKKKVGNNLFVDLLVFDKIFFFLSTALFIEKVRGSQNIYFNAFWYMLMVEVVHYS